MMNRRWLLTAAGTAFLAASSSVLKGQDRSSLQSRTTMFSGDPDARFNALIEKFLFGLGDQIKAMQELPVTRLSEAQLPRDMAGVDSRFRPALTNIYRKRFDYRVEAKELSDPVYMLLLDQACALGQLTGLAFAYETGALGDPSNYSFEKPDPLPMLGVKHLEWARDAYGLFTNSRITPRRMVRVCGEAGGPVQINEPCPLCAP